MFKSWPERAMNSMVNVAPRFSPALEAVRRPPCASITERLIARSQPQSAIAPLLFGGFLLERIEDSGQAIGIDSDAGVGHLCQETHVSTLLP